MNIEGMLAKTVENDREEDDFRISRQKVKTMAHDNNHLLMTDNPWGPRPADNQKPDAAKPFGPKGPIPPKNWQSFNNGGGTPPFLNWLRQSGDNSQKIALGLLAVLLLWLASGLYRVEPEQQAIITRFGRYTDTVEEQGLNYHWPWPFETAQKLNVTFEQRLEIGFRGANGERLDTPEESEMLTGDANIVDIDFVVQWKIGTARDFLYNIRDPENTIKKVAESAMREIVGQHDLQDIITDQREDVANRVRANMQAILDSYQSGVSITQVLIQDASVPPPVLEAFEDVIRATQQAETNKNQAYKYRNEIVPRAQGDAIRLTKEAEGYKEQVVSQAKGEAKRFDDVYSVYVKSPAVTRSRLYIDAVQEVLEKNRVIITDGSGSAPVSFLNLNDLQRATPITPRSPSDKD